MSARAAVPLRAGHPRPAAVAPLALAPAPADAIRETAQHAPSVLLALGAPDAEGDPRALLRWLRGERCLGGVRLADKEDPR